MYYSKQLVAKLQAEVDEIKELILDTLHFCMRVDTDHALGAGAMEVYTDLLTHSIDTIRAKVANGNEVFKQSSFKRSGKETKQFQKIRDV